MRVIGVLRHRIAGSSDGRPEHDLPDVGATVVIDGVHVEVEQVVDRTVASVLATPVLPAGEGNGG